MYNIYKQKINIKDMGVNKGFQRYVLTFFDRMCINKYDARHENKIKIKIRVGCEWFTSSFMLSQYAAACLHDHPFQSIVSQSRQH